MNAPYSRVVATGSYLPSKVLSNADLQETLDTTDEWIRLRTGILERRIAAHGQTTCELAEQATIKALEQGGVSAKEIDLIIVATTTPDRVFPSTACLLQQRIGFQNCAAFDVQAVCTGFIYALGIADSFIRTGAVKCALVIGAELMSRIVNWKDRSTCILFGDGAGAVILRAADTPGVISTHLHADGNYCDLLSASGDQESAMGPHITMQGNEVFRMAVNAQEQIAEQVLRANDLGHQDIDWLVPHQANLRIIKATAKKLNLSMDQVVLTLDRHGNTSAASVPLALDEAVCDGRIQQGQMLLLVAFGGGFTWGAALLRM